MLDFVMVRDAIIGATIAIPTFVGASQPTAQLSHETADIVLQVQFVEDTGSANRVVAGDVLRTVSQEIPSAVCHLHNNVASGTSAELLMEGVGKFDLMLDALINGNEDLSIIGGEERRKTKTMLEDLQSAWGPFREAALKVHNDPSDKVALTIVYDNASAMLDQTYALLTEIEAQYANPVEFMQSDVMLLEVAGRQAMMTQRMSYLACRQWSGAATDNYVEELRTTADRFDFAMNAMRNGMPEVGIKPPPTDEIASLLDEAASDWSIITGHLDVISTSDDPGDDVTTDLYELLAVKMHKMEEVAQLYTEFAKRDY